MKRVTRKVKVPAKGALALGRIIHAAIELNVHFAVKPMARGGAGNAVTVWLSEEGGGGASLGYLDLWLDGPYEGNVFACTFVGAELAVELGFLPTLSITANHGGHSRELARKKLYELRAAVAAAKAAEAARKDG